MSDPFGCGYAVSHFGDPFLLWLWLCGQSLRTIGSDTTDGFMYIYFFIYMGYGYRHSHWLWSLRDCGFIRLYDISLTHIRP